MKYAAIAAAFVAVVAADGWEVYTTVPAKPTTTPAAEEWVSWTEAPKPTTYNSWSEIETSTYKPAPTTSWAVWASTTTKPAPVYTTTKTPDKYTGAANKANMVGAGAVGFAAVAFML